MMDRTVAALAVVISAIIIITAVYGISTFPSSPSPTSSPTPAPSTSPPTDTPVTSTMPSATESPSEPTPTSTLTQTNSPAVAPTIMPFPTPVPIQNITITDMKGNQTVKTPVNRIVCLNGGLAEVICALGGADKIVARTDDVVFPTSLLGLPSMGTNAATTTNLEAILSLNPDLVVSSSALSADAIATIKSGDIPVIIENTADPARVNNIVTNFGKILNNPTKAAEIVNNTQYYTNLIQQRLQSVSDKTTFYYEFSKIWYSMTNKTVMGSVLFSCGGQNIATNVSVSYTTLSPEYVAESNPDVILYSLSGTTNLTDYKAAYANLIGRSVLQDVSAIKDGRVHVFYYYLAAGIRYPVGELYFAKWFYPTLFADINPDAVHAQLIQQYFGVSLTGTYAYSGPTATVSSLTTTFLSVIADTAYNTPIYTYKLTAADVVAPLKKYAVESIKEAP